MTARDDEKDAGDRIELPPVVRFLTQQLEGLLPLLRRIVSKGPHDAAAGGLFAVVIPVRGLMGRLRGA